MQPTKLALAAVVVVGCVAPDEADLPPPSVLEIEPTQLSVTIVDGQPVVQRYVATLVAADGTRTDVTRGTTFTIANAAFGRWQGERLEITGSALGPTHVRAKYGVATADAQLAVFAKTHYIDASAPPYAPALFDLAAIDPTCAPQIAYPQPDTIAPANFGNFEVHWSDVRDDLFEIALTTQYADVRVYTRGQTADADFYADVPATEWQRVASRNEPIALHVSGMRGEAPSVACKSTARTVRVTEPLAGGMFYWIANTGVFRHDLSSPDELGTPVFRQSGELFVEVTQPAPQQPTSCFGCALSQDGARLAVPSSELDYGMIYDVAANKLIVPTDGNVPREWDTASFTYDGSKLIVASNGELALMDETGAFLVTLQRRPAVAAIDPQLSPDGAWLANVESSGYSATAGSSLVVRRFDASANAFGTLTQILAAQPGVSINSPTWSPDGQWLAYTRATGWGTLSPTASLWVMKSDGTQPPIQITAPVADLDITARWAPTQHAIDGEAFFYLAYSSNQPVGVRNAGVDQMWIQPFFPARATAQQDPLGPAVRLPFQLRETPNRIAAWSASMPL